MVPGPLSDPAPDSAVLERVQVAVRAFRRTLKRGERPAIEDYAPADGPNRVLLLIELIHEELEFRVKSGESPGLAGYLARFPEIADDPHALRELIVADSELRRRVEGPGREQPAPGAGRSPGPAPVVRIGRYELREEIGAGAFGVVYRAWDTVLNRAIALKRPRPGRSSGPRISSGSSARPAMPPACGIRASSRSTTPARSTASPTWSPAWSRAATSPRSSGPAVPALARPPSGSRRSVTRWNTPTRSA